MSDPPEKEGLFMGPGCAVALLLMHHLAGSHVARWGSREVVLKRLQHHLSEGMKTPANPRFDQHRLYMLQS